ncbi:alpha beta hydrolase fold protein [Mycena pura]|uniref:Alpha beta hydrolase fold protein n=1 Tax=Mycena pura TaxID=153505 RepID=A0AAD6VVV6_9AGAR|nr:alpha beta hydrolase fold protein [Mycena pura]
MSTSIQYYQHGNFAVSGGTLANAVTAYRTFGHISSPCLITSTAFGGKLKDLTFMIGPDKALDPSRYFIIAFGLFGGGESSSPSTTPPPQDGPNFPKVTYHDNVRAQYTVVTKHFGIERVHAVIGFSMGGQLAYHWPYMYPDFVQRFAVICGSARTSGLNYCFLEGPKNAMLASEDFKGGHFTSPPLKGLSAFARAYSGWPYSAEWFRREKYKMDGTYANLEEFLSDIYDKSFVEGWDANDLVSLVHTWQAGDITEGGDLVKALNKIKAKGRIIPCRTDMYFNVDDSAEEVQNLPNSELVVIESIYGHTAGGGGNEEDTAFIDKQLKVLLSQ